MTSWVVLITEKIVIPLLKSFITALLVALFAAAWFIPSIPWKLFFVVLSGICLVSWLALIVPKPEKSKLQPVILKHQETNTPLKVSIDWNEGQAGLFSSMGITRDQFIAWCIGANEGRSLGENHWCGSRGVFSKGEYHAFRDELERRGLLRPKGRHHAQGFELTGKGRAVAAEVARRFGENGNLSPTQDPQILITDRPLASLRESAREEGLSSD